MKEKYTFKKTIEEASNEEVRKQQEKVIQLKMPDIRTVDYLYDNGGTVTYECAELTALCPMTGIQDLYTVRIQFIPDKKIPELKSLRFYFLAYRDIPIFHEHLTHKIFDDFFKAVQPKYLRIELDVALRGGIHTKVVQESM